MGRRYLDSHGATGVRAPHARRIAALQDHAVGEQPPRGERDARTRTRTRTRSTAADETADDQHDREQEAVCSCYPHMV